MTRWMREKEEQVRQHLNFLNFRDHYISVETITILIRFSKTIPRAEITNMHCICWTLKATPNHICISLCHTKSALKLTSKQSALS